MEKRYEMWVEIQANKEIITDQERFDTAMKQCSEEGITGIILSVKDTSGFVLWKGAPAPYYSGYDSCFREEIDYVSQCFSAIRKYGMKCYGAFDVFAEGNKKTPCPGMKGIENPGWDCEVYGIDREGKWRIQKSVEASELSTVGSIDDFGEVFVNPANEEVCRYELSLIKDFLTRYHPDGIVLDRVRYIGLCTDFSEDTREKWEAFAKIHDERWPEDIYTIQNTENGLQAVPGKYYGSFFEFLAGVIKGFLEKVKKLIREYGRGAEFCDYTGSWYPLYDLVGANWASKEYEPSEFPLCDRERLPKTAYAELLDRLLSGFYYEDVRIEDIKDKPAYWYSVEGAGILARKVTMGKVKLTGSLFAAQYGDCPAKLSEAVAVCMEQTGGCMLFDLSYFRQNDWWKYLERKELSPIIQEEEKELSEIAVGAFEKQYRITEEALERKLWKAPDYSRECSSKAVRASDGALLGVAAVKVSQDNSLYPNTAWLSMLAVRREEQGKGIGSMLLKEVCRKLSEQGIQKIYVGQDFQNFFSGIPEPDEARCRFFRNLGFVLNQDEHYDLEADIARNRRIDEFDPAPFQKQYQAQVYQGEERELLGFLKREFPGRWVSETEEALNAGIDPNRILVLWDQTKSEILGYCMLSVDANGWGGLGPIGIAKQIRGCHVGNYLLHQALLKLREIGADRVRIDWTILKDFYGQFDFKPVRSYRAAYKVLEEKRIQN